VRIRGYGPRPAPGPHEELQIQHDGQIMEIVSSPQSKKYFALPEFRFTVSITPSRAHGGTFRDRHDTQGAGCDGRCSVRCLHRTKTPQRTEKSCGPGAATLALPAGACSRTTGARKAASPGRARISRKTIARGKPGCLGCTCSLTRVLSCLYSRTRDCGRSQRPAFPAPSFKEGQRDRKNPGNSRRGNENLLPRCMLP